MSVLVIQLSVHVSRWCNLLWDRLCTNRKVRGPWVLWVSAHGSCCYWWWEKALISTVWAILFWHYWAQKLTYPLTLWGSISGSFSVRKQIYWLESQDYWKLTNLWPGLWTAFAQVYSASSQQKLKYRLQTSIAYKKPFVGVNKRWNVLEEFEGKVMQSQIPPVLLQSWHASKVLECKRYYYFLLLYLFYHIEWSSRTGTGQYEWPPRSCWCIVESRGQPWCTGKGEGMVYSSDSRRWYMYVL